MTSVNVSYVLRKAYLPNLKPLNKIHMRYKLIIEYDGSGYCGFQKQPDQPDNSIEEILENAVF